MAKYKWKRFFVPPTGNANLYDEGFLSDPDKKYGDIFNSDLLTTDEIKKFKSLVLLGEPGVGKTFTQDELMKEVESLASAQGDGVISIAFRSCGNEEMFHKKLFESKEFILWQQGKNHLYIFLDGLDEGRIAIKNIVAIIRDNLKDLPKDRLSVIISCRTGDWPQSLANYLKEAWGDEYGEFELTYLRRQDVVLACEEENISPNEFIQSLIERNAVPLAIKPVTLQMLLNLYKKDKSLPLAQTELYEKGCLLMCTETNEDRIDSDKLGELSPETRLDIASRIAAATIFGNRSTIVGVKEGESLPEGAISIKELTLSKEMINGTLVEVKEKHIREVLSTGLFSSRGNGQMGWSHQTYAEYLAARYLENYDVSYEKKIDLIIHKGDTTGKIIPQLSQTVAWMAGLDKNVFHYLIEKSPEILLSTDFESFPDDEKRKITLSLLELIHEQKLTDRDFSKYKLKNLKYDGMDQDVRAYVADKSKYPLARRFAIKLCSLCELKILQDSLLKIALDTGEHINLRADAIDVLAEVGEKKTKEKLIPLLEDLSNDLEDELRGSLLRALWKDILDEKTLINNLTPPKKISLFGGYYSFVSHDLVGHIPQGLLAIGLDWVSIQPESHSDRIPFSRLMQEFFVEGWKYVEDELILKSYAKAMLSRLEHHEGIFSRHALDDDSKFKQTFYEDKSKRHLLAEALLPLVIDKKDNHYFFIHWESPILIEDDFDWLISKYESAKPQKEKELWARVLERVFDRSKVYHINTIFKKHLTDPLLNSIFKSYFEPVRLDSETAKSAREYDEKREEIKRKKEEREQKENLITGMKSHLENAKKGDMSGWWRFCILVRYDEYGYTTISEFDPNIQDCPGWKFLDEKDKGLAIEVAFEYINQGDPIEDSWESKIRPNRAGLGGYKAILLTALTNPQKLNEITPETWKKWAKVIFLTEKYDEKHERTYDSILKVAKVVDPKGVQSILRQKIIEEDTQHQTIFFIDNIEKLWSKEVEDELFNIVNEGILTVKSQGELLKLLIRHNHQASIDLSLKMVQDVNLEDEPSMEKASVAARALIIEKDDALWTELWPIMQKNEVLAKRILEDLCNRDHMRKDLGGKLSEEELKDFYSWLVKQYHYSTDPKHDGVHEVGTRDSLGYLRDEILRSLIQRGTQTSSGILREIQKEHPELDWLKYSVLEAENNTRRQTWVPPEPGDIITMVTDPKTRIVQTEDDLLQVTVEALQNVQAKLQGETPDAPLLWDNDKPKSENDFSNYVKNRLEEELTKKGVILSREVEINKGNKTDIHVNAFKKINGEIRDKLTVIIEVKGNWHKELYTAMQTQLLDKYLTEHTAKKGIYLVGWFPEGGWNTSNSGFKKAKKMHNFDKDKVSNDLVKQAESLSKGDKKIQSVILDCSK